MQLISENNQTEESPTYSADAAEAPQWVSDEKEPVDSEPEPAASHDTEGVVRKSASVPIERPQHTVRTEKRTEHPKLSEQMSLFPSEKDLIIALQDAGFTCIDNRKKSGILWILFDENKSETFHEIERQYMLKASFERRGALATKGVPAWRIQMKQ